MFLTTPLYSKNSHSQNLQALKTLNLYVIKNLSLQDYIKASSFTAESGKI